MFSWKTCFRRAFNLFSRLRPGNKDIWYHVTLCVPGATRRHIWKLLPCPAWAQQGNKWPQQSLSCPVLPSHRDQAVIQPQSLLVHAYFIVLEPLILHCSPQLSNKLVLFSEKELIFAKRLSSKKGNLVQLEYPSILTFTDWELLPLSIHETTNNCLWICSVTVQTIPGKSLGIHNGFWRLLI